LEILGVGLMEGCNELEVALFRTIQVGPAISSDDGGDPFIEGCKDGDDIWFHHGYTEELRVGAIEVVG